MENTIRRSIILGEIQCMVNNLKKQGGYPKSVAKFEVLKDSLMTSDAVDFVNLVEPFLHIIQSRKTGPSLTKSSLQCFQRLLPLATKGSVPNSDKAINRIIETTIESKFADVTRVDYDEGVELAILQVLGMCLKDFPTLFSGETTLKIINKLFEITTQPRRTDTLRDAGDKIISDALDQTCIPMIKQLCDGSSTSDVLERILKCLIGFVKSGDGLDESFLIAIDAINRYIIFSASSLSQFPAELLNLFKDNLTLALIKSLRSQNLSVVTKTLRTFYNLYLLLKSQLKLQVELFLNKILTQILENKKSPYAHQEVALELIVELVNDNSFVTELYVNYDCDIYSSNVFESLCQYLYKNAFPVSGSLNSQHLLALKGLQGILTQIKQWCGHYSQNGNLTPIVPIKNDGTPTQRHVHQRNLLDLLEIRVTNQSTYQTLKELKLMKDALKSAVELFNLKPANGIRALQENGLMPDPINPVNLASFMLNCPILDKTAVGSYLGDPSPVNVNTLCSYIQSFVQDFQSDDREPSLVATVRAFLESFRLPKEAQIISRIFEHFGRIYYQYHYNRGEGPTSMPFENEDAVYIMCFSLVMLNTDLHNLNIKKKMTLDEFVTRTTNMPQTANLPVKFLENVFEAIRKNEIKLPDEHPDEEIPSNTWNSLMRRSRRVEYCRNLPPSLIATCNRDVFSLMWGPLLVAFYMVFDAAMDDAVVSQALGGFHSCALISAQYNLNEVFDNLTIAICKFSTIPQLVPITEHNTQKLSDYSANSKAHLATFALFELTRNYGSHLREGWINLLDCLSALNKLRLLPSDMFEFPSIFTEEGSEEEISERQETAYNPFSFLGYSKWFSGATTPASPEKVVKSAYVYADADVQLARSVIEKCDIKGIFDNANTLHFDSLQYLLKSIMLASSKTKDFGEISFYQDLLTKITLANQNRILQIWVLIQDYVINAVSMATPNQYEKSTTNFLLIINGILTALAAVSYSEGSQGNDEKNAFLEQTVKSLEVLKKSKEISKNVDVKVSHGISKIITTHAKLFNGLSQWMTIFSLLEFSQKSQGGSMVKLRCLQGIFPEISKENFALMANTGVTHLQSPDVTVGPELFSLLLRMFHLVPSLFNLNSQTPMEIVDAIWKENWNPIIQIMVYHWRDKRQPIRDAAVRSLKDALLFPELQCLYPHHWAFFFERNLLPLLAVLCDMKEMAGIPVEQIAQLRLAGVQLLCKTLLQHMNSLGKLTPAQFKYLWMKIIQTIQLYVNESGDNMKELIIEGFKNVLLVMYMSGLFTSDIKEDPNSVNEETYFKIWQDSWMTIDSFCPSLREEVLGTNSPTVPRMIREVPRVPSPSRIVTSPPSIQSPSPPVQVEIQVEASQVSILSPPVQVVESNLPEIQLEKSEEPERNPIRRSVSFKLDQIEKSEEIPEPLDDLTAPIIVASVNIPGNSDEIPSLPPTPPTPPMKSENSISDIPPLELSTKSPYQLPLQEVAETSQSSQSSQVPPSSYPSAYDPTSEFPQDLGGYVQHPTSEPVLLVQEDKPQPQSSWFGWLR
eukprot:TRINITY_DN974_c0_g3_i1.p1 TRINITY_DN974_c0_g3~~TRINITY_DN974_c0_g3_i1.p1  ORF type:complete len:1535 (-),score=517.90 TRINITY_DN974_c0_g3_i1:19-4623(-)